MKAKRIAFPKCFRTMTQQTVYRGLCLAILLGTFMPSNAWSSPEEEAARAKENFLDLQRAPDAVEMVTETNAVPMANDRGRWNGGGATVVTDPQADGLHVSLAAPDLAVKKLHLRWRGRLDPQWKYLADRWERAYSDLKWDSLDGNRPMPWYFLATNGRITHGYGVKTCPSAMCCWKADGEGISLWTDVRCGGKGVQLGKRTLDVCTVASRSGQTGETPFAAAQAFCRQMCPKPRLPQSPVYGFNNWYCDYDNTTAESVVQYAAFISKLSPPGENRPWMVIDDGWQANKGGASGAWDRGNAAYPDMPGLAKAIRQAGARPGIWIRLLIWQPGQPEDWRLARDKRFLDPSVPGVRAYVLETVKRLRNWGFDLIKHDFSTFDLCGRWGFQTGDELIADGWAFADRSRTTAEIIVDHYRSIREAAGDDGVVLGCNTIGHLSAGIFEVSRIGDDTSGEDWNRVKKMGVNCLAFRAPQHNTFYAVDADCVGQSAPNSIPWEKNKQWLDLLSRSGTPLFISFKLGTVTAEQEQALREALKIASQPQPLGEPLDWLDNPLPQRWRLMNQEAEYHW